MSKLNTMINEQTKQHNSFDRQLNPKDNITDKDEVESKIIKCYKPGVTSLRDVAKICKTNHHRVKRVLDKYTIPIMRAIKPRTKKYQNSLNIKNKYKSIEEEVNNKNITNRNIKLFKAMASKQKKISFKFLIANFNDYNKIKMLSDMCRSSGCCSKWGEKTLEEYYLKYYNDCKFNRLYKKYLDINGNLKKWYKPSIDHIIPRIKGGTDCLDNIEITTWFENKSKGKKDKTEWEFIKEFIKNYNLFDFTKILLPENINKNIIRNCNKTRKKQTKRTKRPGTRSKKVTLMKNLINGLNKPRKTGNGQNKYNINIGFFHRFDNLDINKIKLLNRMRKRIQLNETQYKQYLNTFYYNNDFNKLYTLWANGYNFCRPVIDHIIPVCRGGTDDLDNLQILSDIENYMKSSIDINSWFVLKKEFHHLL
jgi:hypothetical protein